MTQLKKESKLYSDILSLMLSEQRCLKVNYDKKEFVAIENCSISIHSDLLTPEFTAIGSIYNEKLVDLKTANIINTHFSDSLKNLNELKEFDIDPYAFHSLSVQEIILILLGYNSLTILKKDKILNKLFKFIEQWSFFYNSTIVKFNSSRLFIELPISNEKITIIICLKSIKKTWTKS